MALAAATIAGHVVNRRVDLDAVWPDLTRWSWLANASSAIMFAVPGWLLATRRPRVVYGWLALAAGMAHGMGGLATEWVVASQIGGHRLIVPTVALSFATWGPLVEQPVLMVAYGLYPDGRLPRSWLRWPVLAAIVATSAGVLDAALDRFPGRGAHAGAISMLRNALGVAGANSSPDRIAAFFGPSAVVVVIVLALRRRDATGDERRLLTWIVAVAVPVTVLVPISVVALPPGIGTAVAQFSTLLEVSVIVSATLRHHVYGIDVVLNRALLFTALTAVVASVYGAIVGVAAVFGARTAGPTSFAAALIAALVLMPARERLQRGVNRLLYGERDEPYVVLSNLAAQLESVGHAEQLLPALVDATSSALRLPYLAIVVDDPAYTVAAGTPQSSLTHTPLVHQGKRVGSLVAGHRAGQAEFAPREQRLLDDVARQTAIAVSNVALTRELRRSREQIVTAREEERRRLRMDLHDGLGPQLTGVALGLEMVIESMEEKAPSIAQNAERLRDELDEAIQDVRRLVQGLRPPRLDEVGLVESVRELTARAERGRLRIDVDTETVTPIASLPAAVEVAAYRIVAEAITNVVRHADATRCRVVLRMVQPSGGTALLLRITDDGRGLDELADTTGTGSTSMRRRAEELGGTWVTANTETGGCCVEAVLPIGLS